MKLYFPCFLLVLFALSMTTRAELHDAIDTYIGLELRPTDDVPIRNIWEMYTWLPNTRVKVLNQFTTVASCYREALVTLRPLIFDLYIDKIESKYELQKVFFLLTDLWDFTNERWPRFELYSRIIQLKHILHLHQSKTPIGIGWDGQYEVEKRYIKIQEQTQEKIKAL
jgi:hypothetical protein